MDSLKKIRVSNNRKVKYNNGYQTWEGMTDGIIRDSGTMCVYPAHSLDNGVFRYRKCDYIVVNWNFIYNMTKIPV